MSRIYKLHTLAACLAVTFPALADERSALALPSTAITGTHDDAAVDLATPTQAGSRLNLSALETPASTSSISAQQIQQRNNLTVQDAVSRSPGISFIGTPGDGGTGLSARGFTGHGSVMTLFDGTRLYTGAGTQTFPVDPWLVERIDVIRGPASVLYGEGATGAVVNVIPKKPFSGQVQNHLRLGYGAWDRQQLGLDSGGSISERLSYRVTLNRQASNGWVDRTDSRSLALGAALRFDANDDLSFTLAHERGDAEPANDFGTPLIDGHYRSSLRKKNYNIDDDVQRYRDAWTRFTTDWTLSDHLSASNQLYYIKSRRHWRNAEAYSWDADRDQLLRQSYLQIKHNQEQIGDRQTFTLDHRLFGLASTTLVGAEYNKIRFNVDSNSPYDDVGGDYVDPWHPTAATFHSNSPLRPQTLSTTHTFALFAENRLRVTERLSLVTGVRRDQNHIDRDNLVDGTRSDHSLQGGNWRAGLVFAVNDDLSLYGQYATSEDGVNDLISLSPGQMHYDLTESKQTELGLKQRFWEGRGEWTLAAYHIVKKKLLVDDPVSHDKQQAGQQTSDGLEASLELALPHQWQVSANAAVVRATYDDFDEVVGGVTQDRAGNRPANVPRRTANLWVSKGFGQAVEAGLGLRYVDQRYADSANSLQVPGYTVVDANLGWQVVPDVRLGLQLNNLFDRDYVSSAYSGEQWLMGTPRSYFATLDYRF
ncbi:TonB-dependent siderophore receptor [Pseudomonas sp. SWI6]|uniref:TonB-dependent receptor n=1 Tax=Pseudomonas taiwanensis TaxID=470150 RepID=A0ABR6V219_9PSED|nr:MULTISPECIES: TonB-dependent receptor [Pseudomonas]AGZ35801.1 TonB-dependent siderophore receptor [Pseudomonas sp. VLB120]AVD82752.1 TonB-dependent siderophore receptor [Pseudomonas sp. SWI6]AVD89708.1 TonB-dependent siderophore receptor [Pseudomonas sp. SWI44]MBC3474245.1 TonB-dependent receptor [Pseudomonas taiwanensis]MBC3491844.1 TonB-dependent receptor [Pseudomonas taiwanensis]